MAIHEQPQDIYKRVLENLLRLGENPENADVIAQQVALGQIPEADIYKLLADSSGMDPVDMIDAGMQPETSQVIAEKLKPSPGNEISPKGPGFTFRDAIDKATPFLGTQPAPGAGYDGPDIFLQGMRQPGLRSVQAGSEASTAQMFGEFALGGLWQMLDTALLGLPGLAETALEKTGVTDPGEFFGSETLKWIEQPETLPGRIGSGLGQFAGFVAPWSPIAPAKVLGSVGRMVARTGAKTAKAGAKIAKVGKQAKDFQKLTKVVGKGTAEKIIQEGAEVIAKQPLSRGLGKSVEIFKSHRALKAAARGMDISTDYRKVMRTAFKRGSKAGTAYFDDTMKAAKSAVREAARIQGYHLDDMAMDAVEQVLGKGMVRTVPVSTFVSKAGSTFGAWGRNVVQQSIELGAGMAAYKALRFGVVEQLKAPEHSSYADAWADKDLGDAAKKFLHEGMTGLVSGAILGGVKGAVPNMVWKRMGSGWKDIQAGLQVSDSKAGQAWRGWQKLVKVASFGRKGFFKGTEWPDDPIHSMPGTKEGQRRLFMASDMIRKSAAQNAGSQFHESVFAKHKIFNKKILGGARDAIAVKHAILDMRREVGSQLMRAGMKGMVKDVAGAMPRMLAVAAVMNRDSMFDGDAWRDYPGDQLYALLTSMYIGYHGGWMYDVTKVGSAYNMETVYARQMMKMLGAHSPQAAGLGPGGLKGGLVESGVYNPMLSSALWDYERSPFEEGKDYTTDSDYKSDVKAINVALEAAKKNPKKFTAQERQTAKLGFLEHTKQIISFYNQMAQYENPKDAPIPNAETLTDSELYTVGEALVRHQDTNSTMPDLNYWAKRMHKIRKGDDLAVLRSGEDFVKANIKKFGETEDMLYLISPPGMMDPRNPTAADMRLNRLVAAHNDIVRAESLTASQLIDYSADGVIRTKIPDVSRQEMVDILTENEGAALTTLGRVSSLSAKRIDSNFVGAVGASITRLGKGAKKAFFFDNAKYTAPAPVMVAGRPKQKLGVEDVVTMLRETGLINAQGLQLEIGPDLNLGADEPALRGLLGILQQTEAIKPAHDTKLEMTSSEREAVRNVINVQYDLGVNTTPEDNFDLMYRHYRDDLGMKITPRALAIKEQFESMQVIRGTTLYIPEGYEETTYTLPDGTQAYAIKPIGETTSKYPELEFLAEDIQVLKQAGLINSVSKFMPTEGVGEGVLWEQNRMREFLETHYGEEYLKSRSDEIVSLVMDQLTRSVGRQEIQDSMRDQIGRIHLLLSRGSPGQVARAFGLMRQRGAITFDAQNRLKIQSDQLFTKAIQDIVDESMLADSELRGDSKQLAEMSDAYYTNLENIKKMVDPDLNIRPKAMADFARELDISRESLVDASVRVQSGEIENPDALVEHFKSLGAKVPSDLQPRDRVALFTQMSNRRSVPVISLYRGSVTETINIETGEQDSVLADTVVTQGSILRNPYADKIKAKYTSEDGRGVTPFRISTTGYGVPEVNNGGEFNLWDLSAEQTTYKFLTDIVNGRHGRSYNTDSHPANRSATVATARNDQKPGVLMLDGSGEVFALSLEKPNSGGWGELKSASFLYDNAHEVVKHFGNMETIDDMEVASLVKAAKAYTSRVKGAESSLQGLLEAYREFMIPHMASGGHGDRVGLDSDVSRMFEVSMLLEAYGPGYVQEYFDAVGSRDNAKIAKWAVRNNKRANLTFSNHLNIGNSRAVPELATQAAEAISKEYVDTGRKPANWNIKKNEHTGKVEPHLRLILTDGITPDGTMPVDVDVMELYARSFGARDRAGTVKPELHKLAHGTEDAIVGKLELGYHDGWSKFLTANGINGILPKNSVPYQGKNVPIYEVTDEGAFNAIATRGEKLNLEKYVVEVPFSSLIHMSTPSDGSTGAMVSMSKGLHQNHKFILDYYSKHLTTVDSELTREMNNAMTLAGAAQNPQSKWDIIRANAYIRQLLNDTKGGGEFGTEKTDNYSLYEQQVKASYMVNPFSPVHHNQSINLIRKRIMEPVMMKVKNPHGMTSIVNYDSLHGTDNALRRGEMLAPYSMQSKRITEDTSISIEEQTVDEATGERKSEYKHFTGRKGYLQFAKKSIGSDKGAEALADEMMRLVDHGAAETGFYSRWDNGTVGRLYEVLDWVHTAKPRDQGGQPVVGKRPYIHHDMYDVRQFRYGISGPAWRIPTETADDTLVSVIAGFNSKAMGNQMIMNSKDIEHVHGDGDGDKINFAFDASSDVLGEMGYIQNYKDLHVKDDGSSADGTTAEYKPMAPRTDGEDYHLLSAKSKLKYRRHAAHAKRQLGRVISLNQSVSESILRGMSIRLVDETGRPYILRPKVQYLKELTPEHDGLLGENPTEKDKRNLLHRVRYASLADSPIARELARFQQMFVSQPGKHLPEQMLNDEWYDSVLSKMFERTYEAPGLEKPTEVAPPPGGIKSVDRDILTAVLGNYRGLSSIISPEYIDGSARTRTWDSVISNVEGFLGTRGRGRDGRTNLDKNSMMAKVLAGLIGNNSRDAWTVERAILGAIGWDVSGGRDKFPTEPRKGRIFGDLAPALSSLVSFEHQGRDNASLMERLAHSIDRSYKQYNQALGGKVGWEDAEWTGMINDYYHGEQNAYLTTHSMTALDKVMQTFRTDRAGADLQALKVKRAQILKELSWNASPREAGALTGQLRYYSSRISHINEVMPKLKRLDRASAKDHLLNAGGKAPRSIQIRSDREALNKHNESLPWRLVAAQYAADVSNEDLPVALGKAGEDYHRQRRTMWRLGMRGSLDVIRVPKNILTPDDGNTITITPTDTEMIRVEQNWMRQINYAFQEAGILVPLTLASPTNEGLLGGYRMQRGGVIPIYRKPYTRALSFYASMFPGAKAEITEVSQMIASYQVGLNRGWVTSDAVNALRVGRGQVTPISRKVWGAIGKPFPGRFATEEAMNTPAGLDPLTGASRINPDMTPVVDTNRNIRFYSPTAEQAAMDALGDPNAIHGGMVQITTGVDAQGRKGKRLTRQLVGVMPMRKLLSIVEQSPESVTKLVDAGGVRADRQADAIRGLGLSGEIDLAELPSPVAETVERYFVRAQAKVMPKINFKDLERWAGGMRSVNPDPDANSIRRLIMNSHGQAADKMEQLGDLKGAEAQRLTGRQLGTRFGALVGTVLADTALRTLHLGKFPLREWIIQTIGVDPLADDEHSIAHLIGMDEVKALERDYQHMKDGIAKFRDKPSLARRAMYSTRSFLQRTPFTRRMNDTLMMENQEFMARASRITDRTHRIKNLIYEATGENWLSAAFRKRGLRAGVLVKLNRIDKAIEDVKGSLRAAGLHERPKLKSKLGKLEARREGLTDTREYVAQDILIEMVRGVESFQGGSPHKYSSDKYGRKARKLVELYPEFVPAANEARILTNEVHKWLRDTAKVLTDTRIAELRARMSDGGKRPLTPRDDRLLEQLKVEGVKLGRIDAYFPHISPTVIANLNNIYSKIDTIKDSSETSSVMLGRLVNDVQVFTNKHMQHRETFAPEFIRNFAGALDAYGQSIAAFKYRVTAEQSIRETIGYFTKAMRNNQFNEMYGKGAKDMIAYLSKLKQDGFGRQPDDFLNGALNTMRGLSTISKIGLSPITVLRQGSQKLLNVMILGPQAIKEAKALLSSTEYTALAQSALDYVPIGFADTSSQQSEQIMRNLYGNKETFAGKVQKSVSWGVQKGLKWLKEAPLLGETAMRREAFSVMFVKAYNTLARSDALRETFKHRLFSKHFEEYYPASRQFKGVDAGEWVNANGGGKWVTAFEEYITNQSKHKAYDMVRAIHFDYSKISKPEFLRNPALAAMFHLRSYDYFHTELFVDAFKQLGYRAKATAAVARQTGKSGVWKAEDIMKSPEFNFMWRLGAAYAIIGTASAMLPVGLYSYLRPGTLDLVSNFTDWMTGLRSSDQKEKEKKLEKMFFGKGALTQLTGPIVSDMIDLVNLFGADQIGEPGAFMKYAVGLRDYRTLPNTAKMYKYISKLSAPAARGMRDVGTLMNAQAVGRFDDAVWPTVAKHLGMSGAGAEPYEKWASKGVAEFLTQKLDFVPGIEPPARPQPQGMVSRSVPTGGVKTGAVIPKWLGGQ